MRACRSAAYFFSISSARFLRATCRVGSFERKEKIPEEGQNKRFEKGREMLGGGGGGALMN
jgi:hypothetical protein